MEEARRGGGEARDDRHADIVVGLATAQGRSGALKTTSAPLEARPEARQSAPGPEVRLEATRPRPVRRMRAAIGRFIGAGIAEQALRWPLLIPIALASGAAAYMIAPFEPGWPVLAAAFLVPLLASFATRRLLAGFLSFVLVLLACAGGGALAGKTRSYLVAAPVLSHEIGPVRVEGVIAEIDASESSRRIRLGVRAIEGLQPGETPKFVRFSVRGAITLSPGRAVTCRAILSPPPKPTVPGDYAFHRDAWFQQLGAVGFSLGQCQPLATPPPTDALERFLLWIGAVRRAIASHVYDAAGEKGGGMAASMIAGDRSFITPDDAEALRVSGLAHLLSISGVHMVLAGGIFFFGVRLIWPLAEPLALRMPAVQVAALGAIIACTLYFAISGGEVATQRAYVMALIAFGAKLFDRPAISLRALAVAMFIVVLLQPESVVAPGFQMSFAASAALIALYEMWPRLDRPEGQGVFARAGGWVLGAAATSVVASFATMPFALHHFDRAALFSVVANLVSTPIISFWTTPAAAAAALAAPFGLEEPFFALMGKSLETVIAIAHWSADLSPDVDLPRLSAAGMVLAASAIATFCIFRGRGRLVAVLPAAIAAALWLTGPRTVGYVASDGSVFLKAEEAWLELTDWRTENGLNPLAIDATKKAPCPGKGAPCRLELPSGVFEIIATNTLADPACPASAALAYTPALGRPLPINPCALAGQGGAAIELSGSRASTRTARPEGMRPWTPGT